MEFLKATFLRHNTNFYIPINKFKLGFIDINENNEILYQ